MWCVVMLLFLGLASGIQLTDPVNTPSGPIRGMFAQDGTYSIFLGIPFAHIQAENPFGLSTPHPRFNSTFYATNDTIIKCPQSTDGTNTLDCLRLNIFVPNNAEGKIPVLVWIYGGAFKDGFARSYDDEYLLVRQNVIFISFNYRVGPYGFMCLDTEEVPGNQGLRDQYLALKWVKENIAAFGGDPNRITIMGESAGATSIDLHLMSELPKFFNQAIVQSGTGLIPSTMTASNKTIPIIMSNHLRFFTDNVTEALSFLATMTSESVIKAYKELNIKLGPCVEKKYPNIDSFISSHPELSSSIQLNNISIVAGFSNQEGIVMFSIFERNCKEYFKQLPYKIFQLSIDTQFDTDKFMSMVDGVKKFYIGDKVIISEKEELLDFYSDFYFIFPMQRSITRYAKAGAQVFQYLFSYDGNRNFFKRKVNGKSEGAAHGDDLGYLFAMPFISEQPTAADRLMIDRMTAMWTNFAKYGNPTPSTSKLLPVIWPRVSKDRMWYLSINCNLTVGTSPYHDRMAFWDLFLVAYQDKLWANINRTSSATNKRILIPYN